MGSRLYCGLRACAFLAAACLYGCGTTPLSPKEEQSLTTVQRGRLNAMKVYMSREEPPDQPYKVIARVKGISCVQNLNLKEYKQATDEEAIHVMEVRAALLNADAVINADCQASSAVDWVNNCWSSVVCIGDAIQEQETPTVVPARAIAVVPSIATPSLEYIALPPPKGSTGATDQTGRAVAQGAARGAVEGAGAGAVAGVMVAIELAIGTGGVGIIILPYSVAAGAAVGAVGGGALSAAHALSENRPRGAAVPSRDTLTPIPVHLPVAEAMVAAAQIQPERRIELPAPLLGTLCPAYPIAQKKKIASNVTTAASAAEFESESRLKAQGYTQCAEVGMTRLHWDEYRDKSGAYTVLLATARARVQDLASQKTLVTRHYCFQSDPLGSSQPLLTGLQRAQRVLGERMAEDLVIDAIGDGVIENGICGLVPAQTRFRESGAEASGQVATDSGGQAPATSLDPREPVLAWESFPTSRHMAVLGREAEGSVTDVVYDLRIWRDGQAGYTYERLGLSTSVHRIDSALAAGEYRWSIRARFVFAGRPRATTWNYSWNAVLAEATAHVKPPKGGWVICRRDYISDNSSFRLFVPSP